MTASAAAPLDPTTRATYMRLARWLAARQRRGLRVLGINGAQASGKSTLAAFLVDALAAEGLRAVATSIDDFYLGRAARAELAARVHPLLATRGVPGTHDVERGIDCLARLKRGDPCALPQFSKAQDDVMPRDRPIAAGVDLVIFEGWCVGTPPQAEEDLVQPVNALERDEDADGRWRRHVNAQLAGRYARWFASLDARVFLRVPGWEQVRRWRAQQERETASRNGGRSAYLDDDARERFLAHYQRLTQHALAVLPGAADAVIGLDDAHAATLERLAEA